MISNPSFPWWWSLHVAFSFSSGSLVFPFDWARTWAADSYVVFTEELAPVHYTESVKLSGIATEIVQAIFQEAGLRADIRSYPWKRTYQNALQNKDAFVYTINRTPEREELF